MNVPQNSSFINVNTTGRPGGTVGLIITTSQLLGPGFDPALGLLSVKFHVVSLCSHQFPLGSQVSTRSPKNMQVGRLATQRPRLQLALKCDRITGGQR